MYKRQGYAFPAPSGRYVKVLDSDAGEFDGFARLENDGEHLTVDGCLSLYLPSRCAIVLVEKDSSPLAVKASPFPEGRGNVD